MKEFRVNPYYLNVFHGAKIKTVRVNFIIL